VAGLRQENWKWGREAVIWRKLSGVLTAGAILMLPLLSGGAQADSTVPASARHDRVQHVVILTMDGGHRELYTPAVAPTISRLASQGLDYVNAVADFPGDSVPGNADMFTGNQPTATGLLYDTFYDRHYQQVIRLKYKNILAPGTTAQDYNRMPSVFQAATSAGLTSMFIAKDPAYAFLNGTPAAGPGITDLETPNLKVICPDVLDYQCFERYDDANFTSLINSLTGPAAPAIAGYYVQAVSSAQKFGGVSSAATDQAIGFEDNEVQRLVTALQASGAWDQTVLIITGDHGNTPLRPNPPDCVQNDVSAANACSFISPASVQTFLGQQAVPISLVQQTADNADYVWLSDPSQTAAAVAALSTPAAANQFAIRRILTQQDFVALGAAPADRTPDFALLPLAGYCYDSNVNDPKRAEHGGLDPADQAVPMIVTGGAVQGQGVLEPEVHTEQIAATIANLLNFAFPSAAFPALPGVQGAIH
jgi:hypothetical protein